MSVLLWRRDRLCGWLLLVLLSVSSAAESSTDPNEVLFGRDVRPILSDRCYLCHGPDRANQQAGLRLDSFESATAQGKNGAAIVPGDSNASLMFHRIRSKDPNFQMPPQESG